MVENQRIAQWAQKLHAWGLNGLAAAFLDAGGPLPFLSAQALYFVEPLFGTAGPRNELATLARLLEDPAATQALTQALTEEPRT